MELHIYQIYSRRDCVLEGNQHDLSLKILTNRCNNDLPIAWVLGVNDRVIDHSGLLNVAAMDLLEEYWSPVSLAVVAFQRRYFDVAQVSTLCSTSFAFSSTLFCLSLAAAEETREARAWATCAIFARRTCLLADFCPWSVCCAWMSRVIMAFTASSATIDLRTAGFILFR